MSGETSQFFNPWESPPRFTAPPEDPSLAKRVVKLAEYCVRNGPGFVGIFKDKQKDNAEYAFLFAGEGAEYWRWVLYCHLYNFPPEHNPAAAQEQTMVEAQPATDQGGAPGVEGQQAVAAGEAGQQRQSPGQQAADQPAGQQPQQQQQQPQAPEMPAEYAAGFAQVLAVLNGSRDSVEASRDWFVTCEAYAGGMAAQLAAHALQLTSFEAQQPLLYLINAVLFAGLDKRPDGAGPEADHIAQAFLPHLGSILGSLRKHAADDQAVVMLSRICKFWGEKGVYHAATIAEWQRALIQASSPEHQPNQQPPYQPSQQPASSAAAPVASSSQPPDPRSPYSQQPLQQQQPASPHAHLSPGSHHTHDQQHAAFQGPYQQQGHSYQGHPQQQGGDWRGHEHAGLAGEPLHGSNPPWSHAAPSMQDPGGAPWQQMHGSYPPPMSHQPMGHQHGGFPGHPPPWGHHASPPMQPHYQPHGAPYATPFPSAPAPPMGGHAMSHQYAVPPPMHALPPQAAPAWYPAPPGVPGVPGGVPPSYPAPPAAAPHTPPPLALAAAAAAAALNKPAPESDKRPVSPTDPMSFPPGLIPELVRQKLETDPPYSPLSTLDVDRAGLPEPSQPDAYLRARLDKFHAELKAWRPGTTRADLEDEQRKAAGTDAAAPGANTRSRRSSRLSETGGLGGKDDGSSKEGLGSGAGQSGSGMAGLGWSASAEDEASLTGLDSTFDSFRKQRAGRYRDNLAQAAANAQAT
ncbi:hypothetical protein WJX74_002850 [Apatococcus lobatus]|uniref:CID domain-containing protein n=1 Tax=Apatococcus lobatus TaxID=904363 RepID=A0AAW1SFY3_9CHLO